MARGNFEFGSTDLHLISTSAFAGGDDVEASPGCLTKYLARSSLTTIAFAAAAVVVSSETRCRLSRRKGKRRLRHLKGCFDVTVFAGMQKQPYSGEPPAVGARTWPAQLTWGDRGSSSAADLMERRDRKREARRARRRGAVVVVKDLGNTAVNLTGGAGLGGASGFMAGVGLREAMRGLGEGRGVSLMGERRVDDHKYI